MSFQAVAWAIRQKDIPTIPKFILTILCERANPETGECWPGIESIAEAVNLSPRSTVSYIGALVRNGYVEKQAMRAANGKKRNNHYWIVFDRPPVPWLEIGREENSLSDDGASDHVQTSAHGETEKNPDSHVQTDSHGPCATACTWHSNAEPPGLEPSESEQVESPRDPAPPPAEVPKPLKPTSVQGFDRSKRQAEQDRIAAADKARKPQRLFVFEGSDPWKAHVRNGHPPTLKTWGEINGKRCQGWYFPTLYPPKSTGPPQDHLTESDIRELAKG